VGTRCLITKFTGISSALNHRETLSYSIRALERQVNFALCLVVHGSAADLFAVGTGLSCGDRA
jgi:hypothetical protein